MVNLFPLPILGVVLAFESLALLRLIVDVRDRDLVVAMLVGIMAATLPYGYLIGALVGTILIHLSGIRLDR